MNKKEINLLEFIYERLSEYHKEPTNCDYMLDFKKLIDKYDAEINDFNERVENEEEEYDDSLFFDTL